MIHLESSTTVEVVVAADVVGHQTMDSTTTSEPLTVCPPPPPSSKTDFLKSRPRYTLKAKPIDNSQPLSSSPYIYNPIV